MKKKTFINFVQNAQKTALEFGLYQNATIFVSLKLRKLGR